MEQKQEFTRSEVDSITSRIKNDYQIVIDGKNKAIKVEMVIIVVLGVVTLIGLLA